MKNVICRKVFDLGKIDYRGTGRKTCPVTIELELRANGGAPTFTVDADGTKNYTGKKTPEYTELSICGHVWNSSRKDCYTCGQCLDEINKYTSQMSIGAREKFDLLYKLWKRFHLNGMNAGTPEQEAAIKAWKHCGHVYDYQAACDFLKEIDLYEVTFTGKTVGRMYNAETYTYGHAWVVNDLPESVVELVKALCKKENAA